LALAAAVALAFVVESGLVKATDFLIAAPLSDPPLLASPPADGPAEVGFEAGADTELGFFEDAFKVGAAVLFAPEEEEEEAEDSACRRIFRLVSKKAGRSSFRIFFMRPNTRGIPESFSHFHLSNFSPIPHALSHKRAMAHE
jgi:hypothetical protein